MPNIHRAAIVHPQAVLADDVEVGPYSIVESDVEIGPRCVLREHVTVRRYTTLGEGNLIDSHVVLGGEPQDLKWDPEIVSYLRIGDGNVIREGVTISRGGKAGAATVIGNRTYFMGFSHAAHDAVVEDEAILCNGVLVAGHAAIGRQAYLSGHVLIHQFTWIGEGVMSRGNAAASMHVPPFSLFSEQNNVSGMNVIGMRRADLSSADRAQVKEAFGLTYRSGLSPAAALEEMDHRTDWGAPAVKFRDFIRKVLSAERPYNRGLCPMRRGKE